MFCTGRGPQEIELMNKHQPELRQFIDINHIPLGTTNGCCVIIDGKLHSQVCIDRAVVLEFSRYFESKKYPFFVYTNQGMFSSSPWNDLCHSSLLPDHPHYLENESSARRVFWYPHVSKCFKNFESEVFENIDLVFHMIVIRTIPELKEKMMLELKQFQEQLPNQTKESRNSVFHNDCPESSDGNISIISTGPYNIEIMNYSGNKAYGMEAVAKYFKIPLGNTIAIGDHDNDIPMLEVAGIGVAMGNAEDDVKKVADFVTLTNEESGVAVALQKFLFS